MRQADGLGEILIAAQTARQRAANLGHFYTVRQPVAVVVALGVDEDLRLVLKPAKCSRVNNPVPVTLEFQAVGILGFRIAPAAAGRQLAGMPRQRGMGFMR